MAADEGYHGSYQEDTPCTQSDEQSPQKFRISRKHVFETMQGVNLPVYAKAGRESLPL